MALTLKSSHYATPWILVLQSLSCHCAFEPQNVSEVLTYYNLSGLIMITQSVVSSDKVENILPLMTKTTLLLSPPSQKRMTKQPMQPIRRKAEEVLNLLSKSNCRVIKSNWAAAGMCFIPRKWSFSRAYAQNRFQWRYGNVSQKIPQHSNNNDAIIYFSHSEPRNFSASPKQASVAPRNKKISITPKWKLNATQKNGKRNK